MYDKAPAVLLVGVSLALAGCAVIHSSMAKPYSSGLVYSLPKGQVLLKAERKRVTADDVMAAQKEATDLAELVDAETKALADAKKKADKVLVTVLTAALSAHKTAAAAAKAKADNAAKSVESLQETATLTVLPVVPDPDPVYRYVANLNHLPTRDDDLKMSVTNGLLTSSDLTSIDQTANIIVQLAATIATFTGVPAGLPPVPPIGALIPPPAECPSYNFAAVFDPTDRNAVTDVTAAFTRASQKAVLTLSVDPKPKCPGDQQPPESEKCPEVQKSPQDQGNDGLFYRTPTSVVVSMTVDTQAAIDPACSMKTLPTAQSLVAVVPDSRHIYRLPSTAGAFTTTSAKFLFSDGMPTSYSNHRPSELLAFVSIPVDIAKAIVSVPAQVLQARINYDSQATARINAQVESLKAQLEALQAQRALDAAKTSQTTGSTP